MAFVPIDCLSIPVSSFDSFLLKREFSGEFLCLGVCAPPALEFIRVEKGQRTGNSGTEHSSNCIAGARSI